MILIIAPNDDDDAWRVQKYLKEEFSRDSIIFNFDPSEFRISHAVSNLECQFSISLHDKVYALHEFAAVWFKAPFIYNDIQIKIDTKKSPEFINSLEAHYRIEARSLSYSYLDLIINSIPRSLGYPFFEDHNKLTSLRLARLSGLDIIKSIVISNKLDFKEQILESEQEYISKNVYGCFVHCSDNIMEFTPTCLVDKKELYYLLDNTFFPSLFQVFIRSHLEMKVIYIDGATFPVLIRKSQTIADGGIADAKTLAYTSNGLCYQATQIDLEFQSRIRHFMNSIGMNFGVLDFIIDEATEIRYFLEVNPYGIYGEMANACNYNINLEISKYLCRN